MIEVIAVLGGMVMFVVLATLATVLLACFFASSFSSGRRVFIAALGGPFLVVAPLSGFALFDDEIWVGLMALAMMIGVGALAIGWPVANIATKRLDRMTKFDLETFE